MPLSITSNMFLIRSCCCGRSPNAVIENIREEASREPVGKKHPNRAEENLRRKFQEVDGYGCDYSLGNWTSVLTVRIYFLNRSYYYTFDTFLRSTFWLFPFKWTSLVHAIMRTAKHKRFLSKQTSRSFIRTSQESEISEISSL